MVFGLNFGIPYWMYWLIAIVVSLCIYFYLFDDSMKSSVRKFLYGWGIWLGIFLAWLFCRDYWGFFQQGSFFTKQANTYFLFIALLWGLILNFLARERYESTQAICDNRSGSCAEYQEIADYIILNIGSIDADLLPWSFGLETWVVPRRHFNKINGLTNSSKTQIKIDTQVQKSDITELPPKCHDFIETTKGYNKDDIYYGEFSLKEQKDTGISLKDESGKKLSISEYEDKLKDLQRMLNESRTMVKGKLDAMLKFISSSATIQKKASLTNQNKPPESEM